MRFAADAANERTLIRGFCRNPDFDVHHATACMMYGVTEPSKRQRKFGKIINFTTIYGGGENRVHDALLDMIDAVEAKQGCREFGYRLQPGETPHRALAQLIRQRYFKMLPNMLTASRERAKIAERRGFTINAFGRHRYLEADGRNGEPRWYATFNTEIQGTAADAAKAGLVALYRELQVRDGVIGLMLQIHDEAVYESDGDPRTDKRVLKLLKHTRFKVPIIADVSGSSTSWQDKESIKL
jgi:DNA polymerase I-like protein with 3'-5' exonuclease and polymerase domains